MGIHGGFFFSSFFYCFEQKKGDFTRQAWLMLLSKTQVVFASQLEGYILELLTSPAQPETEQACLSFSEMFSLMIQNIYSEFRILPNSKK